MLEMYNFRNIVRATSFKHLFKEVDEPKKLYFLFKPQDLK